MLIHNPIFTGSISLNGTDISQISTVSTDSSSFASRITNNESTSSAYVVSSGSFSTRIANTESTASAYITASGSFSTRTTAVEATASQYVTASGSLAARLTSNEAKTGSFATTGSNFFIGTQVITGSVFISSNLVVQGSSSLQNITASAVSVGTNTIILNTATPILQFGGISVQDSGSTAGRSGSLLWNSINDHWINVNPSGSDEGYNSAMVINGPKNTGSLGQEAGLTTGYVPRSQGEDHIEDSPIYSSGSLVGIGTTNLGPDGLSLFVQNNYSWSEGSGNAYATLFRQRNSGATVVASGYKRSNTAAFASSYGTSMARAAMAVGYNNGSIAFFTDTATNVANGTDITPTERLTILNDGKVGIGTTSPNAPLDVTSATSNSSGIQQWSYNSAPTGYRLQLNTIVSSGLVKYSFDMLNNSTAYNNTLVLDRGRVGIGQTGPGVALSVAGQSEAWQLALTTTSGIEGAVIGSPSANVLAFGNWAGNERMRITSGGDIQVSGGAIQANGGYLRLASSGGTTTGGYFIRKASWLGTGTDHTPSIAAEGGYGINFYTNGSTTERMVITSGGNVGIGTISPGTTLHVNGDITANTLVGAVGAPTFNNGTTIISFYNGMPANSSRAAVIYNAADSPTTGGMWSIQFIKWDGAYGSMTALNMEPGTQNFYVKTLYNGTWSSWVQK